MKVLLILSMSFLLVSCGFHQGTMVSNASLGDNDFEIIDMVTAQNYTKKYFGLGGLDKKALVLETKQNLYNKYPLKKNQVFANISVDFHNSTIFFVNKVTCTISADLVQFGPTKSDSLHKVFHLMQIRKAQKSQVLGENELPYYIGQSVYFKSGKTIDKGKIKAIAGQINLIQVIANDQSYNLSPEFVFFNLKDETIPESLSNYNVKKEIIFFDDNVQKKGYLVGANTNSLVLKSNNELFVRAISDLKL